MYFDKAKKYLDSFGLGDRVRVFDESSATVELAAARLGCEGALIAKTMGFIAPRGPVLVVVAGDAKIDNRRFKDEFGGKARMMSPEQLEQLVGYSAGGVCPFDVNEGAEVWLDVSLRRFETVYPACGSDNSAVALSVGELEAASRALGWVDVCHGWQPKSE